MVQSAQAQSSSEWTQQAKLTAADGDAGDEFGFSVAVSSDGTTAVIGASIDEDPNGSSAGSAYVFSRDGDSWSQQAKLTPDDGDNGDQFGWSVAVSSDGTTAVIGGWIDENSDGQQAGSAHVFSRDSGSWTQQAKLTAGDGDDFDQFGWSVAVSSDGTTAVIGANADGDPNGQRAGSAYVFSRDSGSWSQQAKLTADDGDNSDRFGESVAVSSDGTAVIGASSDEDPNGQAAGSAYVFSRDGDSWNQQAKLTADNGDEGDSFGWSVAISSDGTTAAIGARGDEDPNGDLGGSAYVFNRDGDSWSQQAKLTASDGDDGDRFGQSVAISSDGTTAVIGASSDEDPNGFNAGSAYVFSQDGDSWSQQAKLAADDGDNSDRFGESGAVLGDGTAVVGASEDEDPNGEAAGSAYVFTSGDGSDGSDGGNEDSPLGAYTDENGVVGSQGLLDAAADFRAGEIDAPTLLDVAAAFRSGDPVT